MPDERTPEPAVFSHGADSNSRIDTTMPWIIRYWRDHAAELPDEILIDDGTPDDGTLDDETRESIP